MNIRRSLAALRLPASMVIGLLAVSSAMGQSGTPATPIALKLTASENAMTVSTTNSTTWDSLIVSHRAVSPLGEVHLAALAADKGQMDVLKAIGARLWTDQTTFITLPEGGIYWAFAHNEAGWASARIELPLPEGRLAVWRDAATNHLLVRISVPSQVAASTKLALLLDNVQISEQAISGYAMSGTGYDASNLSSDSKTLWLSIPVTPEAKGTLKAIFELTPKPIELEVLRPTTSAVLAGASHLLERLTKEKGNPLLNVSTTGTPITYAPATQLGYWKSLVEIIPTWQGYGELFEKLLTKKKGTHTTWDGTEAELSASDLSSAMSAVAASALTPRLSQQNLTGPVYYGAYTRAMLDNDLHFPLKEGEVLQVLWQGNVDLYYYEPNPTDPNSHDSVLTKLSLPNNPDGTAPKDPYGTVKQLLLTKGTSSDLYAKIANNGLWVKGGEFKNNEYSQFGIFITKTGHQGLISGIVHPGTSSEIDLSIINMIEDAGIEWTFSELTHVSTDTSVIFGCGNVDFTGRITASQSSQTQIELLKGEMVNEFTFTPSKDGINFHFDAPCIDNYSATTIEQFSAQAIIGRFVSGEKVLTRTIRFISLPLFNSAKCDDYINTGLFDSCTMKTIDAPPEKSLDIGARKDDGEVHTSSAGNGSFSLQIKPGVILTERTKSVAFLKLKSGGEFIKTGSGKGLSISYVSYVFNSSTQLYDVELIPLKFQKEEENTVYAPDNTDLVVHTGTNTDEIWVTTDLGSANRAFSISQLVDNPNGGYVFEDVIPTSFRGTKSKIQTTSFTYLLKPIGSYTASGLSFIHIKCLDCKLGDKLNLRISSFDKGMSKYQTSSPVDLRIVSVKDQGDTRLVATSLGTSLGMAMNYLTHWYAYLDSTKVGSGSFFRFATNHALSQTKKEYNASGGRDLEFGGWISNYDGNYYSFQSPINNANSVILQPSALSPQLGVITGAFHSHPILGKSYSPNFMFSNKAQFYAFDLMYREYMAKFKNAFNILTGCVKNGDDYLFASTNKIPLSVGVSTTGGKDGFYLYNPNGKQGRSIFYAGKTISLNPMDYLSPSYSSDAVAQLRVYTTEINQSDWYWGHDCALTPNGPSCAEGRYTLPQVVMDKYWKNDNNPPQRNVVLPISSIRKLQNIEFLASTFDHLLSKQDPVQARSIFVDNFGCNDTQF